MSAELDDQRSILRVRVEVGFAVVAARDVDQDVEEFDKKVDTSRGETKGTRRTPLVR